MDNNDAGDEDADDEDDDDVDDDASNTDFVCTVINDIVVFFKRFSFQLRSNTGHPPTSCNVSNIGCTAILLIFSIQNKQTKQNKIINNH